VNMVINCQPRCGNPNEDIISTARAATSPRVYSPHQRDRPPTHPASATPINKRVKSLRHQGSLVRVAKREPCLAIQDHRRSSRSLQVSPLPGIDCKTLGSVFAIRIEIIMCRASRAYSSGNPRFLSLCCKKRGGFSTLYQIYRS